MVSMLAIRDGVNFANESARKTLCRQTRCGFLGWIEMDRYHQRAFSSAERRQRNFHWLGIAIAGAIIAVGVALVCMAMVRLDLLENLDANVFSMTAGFSLVLLGAVAIAAYGVVRAIEWANRNR
jgi:hypothetical protein